MPFLTKEKYTHDSLSYCAKVMVNDLFNRLLARSALESIQVKLSLFGTLCYHSKTNTYVTYFGMPNMQQLLVMNQIGP